MSYETKMHDWLKHWLYESAPSPLADMKPDVLPLNRLPVIEAVVQVISSQIPELVELNLSGNRLNTMAIERLSKLIPKTKNLIALDLSENPEVSVKIDPKILSFIVLYKRLAVLLNATQLLRLVLAV